METTIKNYLLKVQNESKSKATNEAATSEALPMNMVFMPNAIKYTVKDIAKNLLTALKHLEEVDKDEDPAYRSVLISGVKIDDIAKKLTAKDCQKYVNLIAGKDTEDEVMDLEYELLTKYKFTK